jgi:hypothetical protein
VAGLCATEYARTLLAMETRPPGKSKGRELVEAAAAATAGSVPVVGAAFAVALVTALNWSLNERRDKWFEDLACKVEDLGERVDGFDIGTLAGNPLFVDAVVSAARTVEHTSQEGKLTALRNAVLNSALGLVDRLTASHLRLLTLWDDPRAWFESHHIALPEAAFITSRSVTVEAGLPEMKEQKEFYLRLAKDLVNEQLMSADLAGNVQPPSLLSRLTTPLGRQLVDFISPPAAP